MAVEPGTDNISREARLASLLPSAVGYPQIIDTGVTDGHEWLLAKELPGRNLGELWPMLDWEARKVALRQLWAKAQAVHSVQISVAAAHARTKSPFYASSPAEAAASLVRLAEAGVLAPRQVAVLQNSLAATVVTPEGSGLLLGYAILLELWSMENLLSKWDGVEPSAQWQPYRTLTALAGGAGGYLAAVLARLAGGNGRSGSRWPRHLAL
jgi:hypothetical protein